MCRIAQLSGMDQIAFIIEPVMLDTLGDSEVLKYEMGTSGHDLETREKFISLVYTWYIPGIWHLYDNVKRIPAIYHVYTCHMILYVIWKVYLWYIPGILQMS